MSISEERRDRDAEALARTKTRVAKALSLMDKGYSKAQIAKELGVSESAVHSLLNAPIEFGGRS